MTNFEIFLITIVAILLIVIYFSRKFHIRDWEDINLKLQLERGKLYILTQEGLMDSILSTKKFNKWFNSDKDSSLYAHSGIFLRLDKLSKSHFDNYIKMTTHGYLAYEDFDFVKMLSFEDRVRKNWRKQIDEL